jgi:hypothetical protein
MSMSVKGRFIGKFGTREALLKAIESDQLSFYDMNSAIKNPQLTHDDLHRMANSNEWYRQHAHNEYFNRFDKMPK